MLMLSSFTNHAATFLRSFSPFSKSSSCHNNIAVLEHSNVISAAGRCKLGVGQIVITARFIVAIATSAKLPPGQYVPADDKLSNLI